MTQKTGERYGSLIMLKPEFEERYIILHRHTFPGVLKRIYDSNIRNFSIFLRDSSLFSYFEYVGANYSEDMDRIAQDATTQDWWKLTDPMQSPLETREKGEWWASMPELFYAASDSPSSSQAFRLAFVTAAHAPSTITALPEGLREAGIDKLSLFYKDKRSYLYLEHRRGMELKKDQPAWEAILAQMLISAAPGTACSDWHPIREVFHTD